MPSRWLMQVYAMELRKGITYRADFWVNFIGQTFSTIVISYFLWKSIFEYNQVTELNGYTLNKMVFYYLVVPLIFRVQQGEAIGSISKDIYEGGLNKFILYPINYYYYKIATYFANATLFLGQLILIIFLYQFFIGDSSVYSFNLSNSIMFFSALILGTLTYFALNSISELISFWADNIWSLGVIVRFFTNFLGGGMVPLAFFPEWGQTILKYTPFPYFISFPIKLLFGEVLLYEFFFNMLILTFWCAIFILISKFVWNRGKFAYTGVGI